MDSIAKNSGDQAGKTMCPLRPATSARGIAQVHAGGSFVKRLFWLSVYALTTAVLHVLDWIVWPPMKLVWEVEALRSKAWLYLENNREDDDYAD